MTLAELNSTPGASGSIVADTDEHGLGRILLTTRGGEVAVCLHRAHVTGWRPAGGDPVLWMSGCSAFAAGKAIRGGVPICFPWFGGRPGRPDAPSHGFARLLEWELESTDQPDDGNTAIVLRLSSSEKTHAYWPYDFELRYRVAVGAELVLVLEVADSFP